jgi:hypothetical protein
MMLDKAGRPLKYRKIASTYRGDLLRRAITVGLSAEIYEWIDSEARRTDVPVSALVANLLKTLFDARAH